MTPTAAEVQFRAATMARTSTERPTRAFKDLNGYGKFGKEWRAAQAKPDEYEPPFALL